MDFAFSLMPLIIALMPVILVHIVNYSVDREEKTKNKNLYKQLKPIFEKYEINEYFQNEIMDIYDVKQYTLNEFKENMDISLDKDNEEIAVWILYIYSLFERITRYYTFEKYAEENKDRIRKMYQLLFDKKYKYNDFLIKNMVSFNLSLKEPYSFLNKADDLCMVQKHIDKERQSITSEVIDTLNIFLSIIDVLYEKYEKTPDVEEKLVEDVLFSELNDYNELLLNIRKDIANRKVIFG